MKRTSITRIPALPNGRRRFLAALGACAMTRPVALSAQALTQAHGALTKEQRDRLTPSTGARRVEEGQRAVSIRNDGASRLS